MSTISALDRRAFLTATGAAAFASLVASAMPALADEPIAVPETVEPAEVYDCDFCVVGAGFAGLSACIEAGEQGLSVIALETTQLVGGGGRLGVEGSFGIESSITKAQDLHLDPREVYAAEMVHSQWRASGQCWMDFMKQSGANIDWLIEHGVEFQPVVDNYHGGDFNTFHWYKDGQAAVGFVPPLEKAALDLGTQFMFETTGKKLITNDEGAVCGIYAQKKDGTWIQVNAKAVMLSTGGVGSNPDILATMGYPKELLDCMFEAAQGYGYLMAKELGAMDMTKFTGDQASTFFPAFMKGQDNIFWGINANIVWINEHCQRFYPEDNSLVVLSNGNAQKLDQKEVYAVWDTAAMENHEGVTGNYIGDIVNEAADNTDGTLFRAETLEELPAFFGLDQDEFMAFIERYNALCAAGDDTEFGKAPEYLRPIEKGPFFIAKPGWLVYVICGGIGTNRDCQVITPTHEPIPGLYAGGVDGVMLYRNVYTIGTPGSCSGWCIYSGRKSVQHAIENIISKA
ncbi:MAG: FAD-binding protein [Coriobacteriales bacterium]|nr:FAD-binding protein [Coriobacteriales bacterium]